MSDYTHSQLRLTHRGALVALDAAVKEAGRIGRPQNICIVDQGCNLLAFVRMDGARLLSIESARKKAETAVSYTAPSGGLKPEIEVKMALATDGRVTNLGGGLPIILDGQLVGGIGVGSGTAVEDIAVASAGLRAIGAETFD